MCRCILDLLVECVRSSILVVILIFQFGEVLSDAEEGGIVFTVVCTCIFV